MKRTRDQATLLERLCRPQRIGVFGHRGAGKTTFLAVLYREAVAGRLQELRLGAGDARTASYLADKVLQLESGEALPATLAQTELRLNLYHNAARLELVLLDYQGEHVALGREEPIRAFLRECDAVWLCLDVPVAGEAASCLEAQQEVEQVVEDYLALRDPEVPHRPMALLTTKSDLLWDSGPGGVSALEERFAMTRHALATHCPGHAVFMISSLGQPLAPGPDGLPAPFQPEPFGLEAPLVWLADALRAQDQARLEHLWQVAPRDLSALAKATRCFATRYPGDPATASFKKRLSRARRRRFWQRAGGAVLLFLGLALGLFAYDAFGALQAGRFARDHADDPEVVRQELLSYACWHPTRHLLRPGGAEAEKEQLLALEQQARDLRRQARVAELRRLADDPDADLDEAGAALQQAHAAFPELADDRDFQYVRARLVERREAQREERAADALRALKLAQRSAAPAALLEQIDRWLHEHASTAHDSEVLEIRKVVLAGIDERDFESAREYSARNPLNFLTRLQRYQSYLERHPEGAFASRAREQVRLINQEWDKHDFRAVRDHFQEKPGDVKEIQALCRTYLAAHPEGKFRDPARQLLRFAEKVSEPGEYKVVLKSGSFDKKVAHTLSRGAYLSVEIEVAGVRYGPSNVVRRSYDPEWNYEFPRKVRWKLGDPVRIYVTDNYYWRRAAGERASEEGDPLALRLLSGEVTVGRGRLVFESDFALPVLPKVE